MQKSGIIAPAIIVIDNRKKDILIVDIKSTFIDNLHQIETEKLGKYDIIAKELPSCMFTNLQ